MDILNKKKLIEKEGEIKRLNQELSDLKSSIDDLNKEKAKEAELHREVTDTMLAEMRAFISANQVKNLTYTSLETLYPLAKDILEKHSFLLKIKINHFYLEYFSRAKHKDFIIAHSKKIVEELSELGLVDIATVDSYKEGNNDNSFQPYLLYQINTTYSVEDFEKNLILSSTEHFEFEYEIRELKFKEMNVTRDGDYLVLSLSNVQRKRFRGF
ncbi:MAG: hypothetical protein WEA58_10865 [Balneolaceae bacterium]